ncbi:biotin transporter BioY [Candidatus Parcubacteria bacterium]|nr:biotin transporter BioY [Candidatus Parcubacteria bacterium]
MNSQISQPVFIDVVLPKIDSRVKNIALVLSFAIITALCSKLSLEIGPIPVTMQTFAVVLAGVLLGSKRGALSQVAYLAGGLAGIPWFSRGGGLVYILSPTFGYIIGFVVAAYIIGRLAEKGWDRKIKTSILAMFVGNVFLYFFGLVWLAQFVGTEVLLAVGLYPFIIGDLLKILLAGLALPLGWKLINRIKH